MRTTLDVDLDVLNAAKEISLREKASAGKVISRLARQALVGAPFEVAEPDSQTKTGSGFTPFPPAGVVITDTDIDQLRDLEGI